MVSVDRPTWLLTNGQDVQAGDEQTLREEILRMESECGNIQFEVSELKETLSRAQSAVDDIHHTLDRKSQESITLSAQKEHWKELIPALQELSEARTQLHQQQSILISLKASSEDSERLSGELEQQLAEAQASIDALRRTEREMQDKYIKEIRRLNDGLLVFEETQKKALEDAQHAEFETRLRLERECREMRAEIAASSIQMFPSHTMPTDNELHQLRGLRLEGLFV